jgi:DNA-directed RNA polymerase specialized sigma24 family protein
MRRILVERARRKQRLKHGGALQRHDLDGLELAAPAAGADVVDVLALHDTLDRLAARTPRRAELVKLRYFAGLSHQDAAAALGIGRRAADRLWALARAWLFQRLQDE